MTLEQHDKQRKGYDDATTGRDKDSKLSGDSWYEQGWMEGKLAQVTWATDSLKDSLKRLTGTKQRRVSTADMMKVKGINDAMNAFFHMIADANGIKEEPEPISDSQWKSSFLQIAAEYIALCKL